MITRIALVTLMTLINLIALTTLMTTMKVIYYLVIKVSEKNLFCHHEKPKEVKTVKEVKMSYGLFCL